MAVDTFELYVLLTHHDINLSFVNKDMTLIKRIGEFQYSKKISVKVQFSEK